MEFWVVFHNGKAEVFSSYGKALNGDFEFREMILD